MAQQPVRTTIAADDEDTVLARKLQAELDAEHALQFDSKQRTEAGDAALARRLQEEADLEAQFEAATQQVQHKELAKQASKRAG